MFNFVQYTISIVFVHDTGNVLNVLNSLLQEVALSILLIHLITLFYSIKYFSVSLSPLYNPPTQNAIPQPQVKIAKYVVFNICKFILGSIGCVTWWHLFNLDIKFLISTVNFIIHKENPTRCNSVSEFLFHIYLKLNMFRETRSLS
jgi:hypothetical protein